MRWFALAALLGLAACGGRSAEVAPSTNPVTSSTTTTTEATTTTEPTRRSSAELDASSKADAVSCVASPYDRACYERVVYDRELIVHADRSPEYARCVASQVSSSLTDDELKTWVGTVAGTVKVDVYAASLTLQAGWTAAGICDMVHPDR